MAIVIAFEPISLEHEDLQKDSSLIEKYYGAGRRQQYQLLLEGRQRYQSSGITGEKSEARGLRRERKVANCLSSVRQPLPAAPPYFAFSHYTNAVQGSFESLHDQIDRNQIV
jgi:hypothetical protein